MSINFYSILVPTINQNRLQNQRKQRLFFSYLFSASFVPMWLRLGSLLAPLELPFWRPLGPSGRHCGSCWRPSPPFWASRGALGLHFGRPQRDPKLFWTEGLQNQRSKLVLGALWPRFKHPLALISHTFFRQHHHWKGWCHEASLCNIGIWISTATDR